MGTWTELKKSGKHTLVMFDEFGNRGNYDFFVYKGKKQVEAIYKADEEAVDKLWRKYEGKSA